MHNKDVLPDLLTHDGSFTGYYTISSVVMLLTASWMRTAAV